MESAHGSGFDAVSLVVLGLLLLGGYLAHLTADRSSIPKVTILLVVGAVCGPSVLDIVPDRVVGWFPFISHVALALVGFLLGESFAGKHLRETGRVAFVVSVCKAVLAAIAVLLAVRLAGGSWTLALVLAGIAPASAPAAIVETIRETRAEGRLSDTVTEIVAIDDAWGILLFSVLLVIARSVEAGSAGLAGVADGVWQMDGALLLGGALGFPMAWVNNRVRGGRPTLVEAAGFVLLCAGLAGVIGVSYLLATMTLGTVVANRTSEDARPFHALDRVREPFMAIFFLLAGFEFDVGTLRTLGVIGAAYVVARAAGFFAGSWGACRLLHADETLRRNIGWCLLPQAGVAMGLALLAEKQLEPMESVVLPLVIATTILFEITGPLLLRWRLAATGEIGRAGNRDEAD